MQTTQVKQTAGCWDRKQRHIYFMAANIDTLKRVGTQHDHMLIAVNELPSDKSVEVVKQFINHKPTNKLFIDSGVYSLTTKHAKAHGMTMDQVLSMAPEEVDGFDSLFGKYLSICKDLGDKSWGYIEVDIGGKEHKRRMRKRIESTGLRPIPVYHPLVDGWDYFDELAQSYDRICFGNIVGARSGVRKRLMATIYSRMQDYPNLWVHLLGMTTNHWASAYPVSSMDSSAWIAPAKWPDAFRARCMMQPFSEMGRRWYFKQGSKDNERNVPKSQKTGAYDAHFSELNWRAIIKDRSRYEQSKT